MKSTAFGRNVRAIRQDAALSQQRFADEIGVTITTVSSWETRGGQPKQEEVVQRICKRFGVSSRDLFGYDDGYYARTRSGADGVPAASESQPVPVLGRTHMGDAMEEESCALEVQVPSDVVEAHPGCFLVHAEGGCMDNRYPADSYLLIDPHMRPFNGCAVLAEVGEVESVVRVYMRGSTTLMLCCDSHSTSCPDIVAGPDDPPVTLKGVVVWYQADGDVRGAE